jgi:hypothetical protein
VGPCRAVIGCYWVYTPIISAQLFGPDIIFAFYSIRISIKLKDLYLLEG